MNGQKRWAGVLLGAGMVVAATAGLVTARAGAAWMAPGTGAAPLQGATVFTVATGSGTATGGSSQDDAATQGDTGAPVTTRGTAADPSSLTATFIQRLAEGLGLSRDRVDAAVREVLTGMVDEAARDGQLSSQEADALRQRIAQGQYRLVLPLGGHGPGWGGKHGRHGGFFLDRGRGPSLAGLLQSVSSTLRLTPGQVLDRLWQGKTLAQIAEEQGVSRRQVKDAIVQPAKQRLDEAVAAGRLPQGQADRYLQRLEDRADTLLDRRFTPPGTAQDDDAGKSGSAATEGTGSTGGGSTGAGSSATGTSNVITPDGDPDGSGGLL